MPVTSEPESKDSASSSGDECKHEHLGSQRAIGKNWFQCQDCTDWVECPHTSWRWSNDVMKKRKICNWCGHEWADKDKQDAALFEAQQLELINLIGDTQFTSLEAVRGFMRRAKDPDAGTCAHVAWSRFGNPASALNGWSQRRQCDDCGFQWTALLPAAAEELPQPAAPEQTVLLAVEYSIGHGTRTVLVPADANTVTIDGDLRISHNVPIHGIVAVRPTYVSQPAGEEQST